MNQVEINKVKKGEFIKLSESAKEVWIANGYCRTNKRYEINSYSDISKFRYLSKGRLVVIDFEF